MKMLKFLSVFLALGIGYFLGVRWVGPMYMGQAGAAPAVVAPQTSSTPSTPAPAPTPTVPQTSDDAQPIATITEGRHHRDTGAADHMATDTTVHHRRHHAVHPAADTSSPSDVGDQSVLPEDKANVGGADHQPPGEDLSSGDSSTGNSSAATETDAGKGQDAGQDNSGDGSQDAAAPPAEKPKPRHTRRHPRHKPAPTPAPDNGSGDNGAGDNSTPGDNGNSGSAGDTTDHGTGVHTPARRWTAAYNLEGQESFAS